jgi:hypothetical protein
MIKRTTIYLDDTELERVKMLSFIYGSSMVDTIRRGINQLYDTLPKEKQEALKILASAKSDFSEGKHKKSTSPKALKKGKK